MNAQPPGGEPKDSQFLALGIAVGVAIGASFGNVAMGLTLGLLAGALTDLAVLKLSR